MQLGLTEYTVWYPSKALSTLSQKSDCRTKVRLSPKTARQRRNSATVALFCDSVDRLLGLIFGSLRHECRLVPVNEQSDSAAENVGASL